MNAQRAMEAQQAAASRANMPRLPGLSEPIMPTANKFAFSTREADAACVEVEPKGEEEDTPLVRRAIEARKSVYGDCSEGLVEAMRKTAKGKLEAYIRGLKGSWPRKVEKSKQWRRKTGCVWPMRSRRSDQPEARRERTWPGAVPGLDLWPMRRRRVQDQKSGGTEGVACGRILQQILFM